MKKVLGKLVLNLTHTKLKPINKSVNTSSISLSRYFYFNMFLKVKHKQNGMA